MVRATCNCGRVRPEHFGKWPPRSPGVVWLSLNCRKKNCVLAAKVATGLLPCDCSIMQNVQFLQRGGSKLSALVTRR